MRFVQVFHSKPLFLFKTIQRTFARVLKSDVMLGCCHTITSTSAFAIGYTIQCQRWDLFVHAFCLWVVVWAFGIITFDHHQHFYHYLRRHYTLAPPEWNEDPRSIFSSGHLLSFIASWTERAQWYDRPCLRRKTDPLNRNSGGINLLFNIIRRTVLRHLKQGELQNWYLSFDTI